MGIQGLDNLIKNIKGLKAKVDKATQKGILKTAEAIKADAKARVPRNLGALDASIGIQQTPAVTYIFADKPYAAFQEFGTGPLTEPPKGYESYAREFFISGRGHTPAQPFLFPAFFKHQDSVTENIESEIKEVLNKI